MAVSTCTKLYCLWVTITQPDDGLIVVLLIRLLSE
jgi:hypothetical protein